MKSIVVAGAIVAFAMGGAAYAQVDAKKAEAAAKQGGCAACHLSDKKKVGPSYKDIAAKYKGKTDAQSALVATLKAAKDHPEAKMSDDDLKLVVGWILSM